MPELNFRGELPQNIEVTKTIAFEFAESLARDTGLRIVDQTRSTGNPNIDAAVSIQLKPQTSVNVWVTVILYVKTRQLHVDVGGDFESQTAKRIARKAEELYAHKYPGSKLMPFTRNRGLLGP
jgi:hypothetical protein